MDDAELSCQEIVELVNDYIEDALSPYLRARVEEHLDECPMCLTYLHQFRATVDATRRLAQEDLDPAVRDELVRAFRDWSAAE